jgi:signal peptide peptidase SppA
MLPDFTTANLPIGQIESMAAFEAQEFASKRDLNVRRLEQYFGPWAILESPFRAAVQQFNRLDLRLHIEHEQRHARADDADGDDDDYGGSSRGYRLAKGGIAIVEIAGTMMKAGSSLGGAASTVRTRRAIRLAANDDDVSGILLRIDSPGGTVSGTGDLASDVAAAAEKKPVRAYVEDQCCSAAYWIASQCPKISANATALVGCIGTYGVLEDSSAAAEKEGIKVHVIKAGAFKGMGQPGTEITAEQLDYWQAVIDNLNEHFIRGVAAGRKMTLTAVRELADGRVQVGADAVKSGLIDAVESFDEALSSFPQRKRAPSTSANRSTKAMSTATENKATDAVAATYAELKADLIGADAAFLCQQLDAGATIVQARKAWMTEQSSRLEASRKQTEAAQAKANKPGVEAQSQRQGAADAAFEGDPTAAWNEALEAELKRTPAGPKQRLNAIKNLNAKKPQLRKAYVEAYNLAHPPKERD